MKKRKIVALILVLSLSIVFSGSALALNEQGESQMFSEAYDALPNDAVVCYMLGQPVYKYEVDEYGFIHKEMSVPRNHSSYYVESLLPSSYRDKPVTARGGMSTQGFYQYDTFFYMDEDAGEAMAGELERGGTRDSILALFATSAISLVPLKSGLITAVSALISLAASSRTALASEIREYTDAHQNLILLEMRNSYGIFRAVHPWDGQYAIRYPQTLNSPSTAWVEGVAGYNGNTIWGASS